MALLMMGPMVRGRAGQEHVMRKWCTGVAVRLIHVRLFGPFDPTTVNGTIGVCTVFDRLLAERCRENG